MKKSLGAKTLAYPAPVFIVGTYDVKNVPNIMNAAWGGICCSEPPCVCVAVRAQRYTYANIIDRKAFSISIPSREQMAAADFVGITSGKNINKFEATGLTAEKAQFVDAPYVKEFPVAIECKLIKELPLGTHTLFIGEIKDVKANEEVLDENGELSVEKIKPAVFMPHDHAYYAVEEKIGQAFSLGKDLQE